MSGPGAKGLRVGDNTILAHQALIIIKKLLEYRKRLIDKIGIEKVEWLEGPHPIVKLTIEDIKEIKTKYTELVKQLERDQQETLGI